MRIEKAAVSDAAALAPLMAQLAGRPAHEDKIAATLEAIVRDPAYHLLVARENGRVIGTMMGIVCYDITEQCQPFMVVENVVTDASARGQGVAKALMDEIERIARAQRCTVLMLCSGAERTGAHAFYRRLGFSDTVTRGFKKGLRSE